MPSSICFNYWRISCRRSGPQPWEEVAESDLSLGPIGSILVGLCLCLPFGLGRLRLSWAVFEQSTDSDWSLVESPLASWQHWLTFWWTFSSWKDAWMKTLNSFSFTALCTSISLRTLYSCQCQVAGADWCWLAGIVLSCTLTHGSKVSRCDWRGGRKCQGRQRQVRSIAGSGVVRGTFWFAAVSTSHYCLISGWD